MTPASAMRAIEARINTLWAGATVISWPNVPFTPPASASWLKVDFIWGNGTLMTKGPTGRNFTTGVLQLTIFGRKDAGDGALDTLAQNARAMFNRTVPTTDVVFGAASGPVRLFEESWRSLAVSVPFQVFETV